MDHSISSLLQGCSVEDINDIAHLDGVCCIYLLVNISNDQVYVGRTVNARNRAKEHFFKDYHKYNGKKLSDAKDFYGKDSFLFYVLEICERDDLVELEQFYLDMIMPFDDHGYNMRMTSSHDASFIMGDEQKRKISSSLKLYYKTHSNPFKGKSHSDKSKSMMRANIRNEDGSHKNEWCGTKKQSEHMKMVSLRDNSYSRLQEWHSKNDHPRKTKILMLSLEEEILNEFDSVNSAAEHIGCSRTSITNCLTGRSKTAAKHKWKYK